MKCAGGIWFPDDEQHLVKMLKNSQRVNGKGTYQLHKLEAALKQVSNWRCALDVGMHVGLWSMHLARRFKTVVGFEPVAEHIECLKLNMSGFNNYQVHQCALGNRMGFAGLRFMTGSTGSTQIDDSGSGVEVKRLDDFAFDAVDFLKIDVECYESFVVEGGEQTIKRHKPIIIIEQKPNTNTSKLTYGRSAGDARRILESWGAKQKFEIAGDYCFGWGK